MLILSRSTQRIGVRPTPPRDQVFARPGSPFAPFLSGHKALTQGFHVATRPRSRLHGIGGCSQLGCVGDRGPGFL
jgi:hypothetical protein